jgi:hypothetical protein
VDECIVTTVHRAKKSHVLAHVFEGLHRGAQVLAALVLGGRVAGALDGTRQKGALLT